MTTRNDAETAITGTNMNEIIPWSMNGEGTTGVKGTETSDEIRREDFSTKKSVRRQLEITP